MKIIKYSLFVLIASMFFVTDVFSQNILTATIEWNSASTFDVTSGTMIDETTKIVSSPTQITWYDSKGVVKQTIDIASADGSWSNVSNNGSVLFKVTSGESSGIAQFIKASGTLRIRLQLILGDETTMYDLTITDVNAL